MSDEIRTPGPEEKLYCLALSATRVRRFIKNGDWMLEPKMAIGVTCGWNESPAFAKQTCYELLRDDFPEQDGWKDREVAAREIPRGRLLEWAKREGLLDWPERARAEGWLPPAEAAALRDELKRLRKKRGRRYEEDEEDE